MGAVHVGAYEKIPGVELGAVCSNSERALSGDLRSAGGNLGRPGSVHDFNRVTKHKDWREFVADPGVDAVDICLPTDLHAEIATAALNAGKHVICEKPMALTAKDCEAMLEAARAAGRVLMIGHVLRFWPEYVYLRDFVFNGEYGAVRSATFVRRAGLPQWSPWLNNEKRSGGAIVDMLLHDIDQVLLLFGPPARVAAKPIGGPDTASATFLYEGGPEVRVQGGWFAPETPFSMSFHVRADKAELVFGPDGLRLNDSEGRSTKPALNTDDAYEAQLGYFVECCKTGKQPERCLPRDSMRAVELALLVKQSRSEGGEQLKCSV